jgi:formylglycine-generating enzyme required for sulfatase activity
MEHRVFISYSSQDKAIADRVCSVLESAGISCWIAPRNIDAGADFPSAIMQAITAAEALVILLTSYAVASPHVLSEIDHAFNAKKRMLTVRLSSLNLPPDFDYFLSTQQWFDASEGFTDETLNRLTEAVSGTLANKQVLDFRDRRRKRTVLVAGCVAILLAAIGIFAYSRFAPRPRNSAITSSTVISNIVSPDHSNHGSRLTTWVNPKDGQKYVWVVPGSFIMGCSAADSECKDDEKPAHRVEIPSGFWLGQTEVTNEAYRRVEPSKASATKDDPALPIRGLSWPEAKAYCIAAGGRLPTEAEWEYAARGGSPEAYYGVPSKIAWYANNSGGVPHPVGMKEPNAFGLYDVLGNVSEWVLDRYYNKYDLEADAVGPHIDQPLPGNSSAVSRGGFWDGTLPGIRVSHRAEQPHDEGVEKAGVRCANDHR